MMTIEDEKLWETISPVIKSFSWDFIRKNAAYADEFSTIPEEIENHPMYHILSRIYVPTEFGGGWPIDVDGQQKKIKPSAVLSTRITEELAFGDPGLTCGLPGPSLCYPILEKFGDAEQKRKYFSIFLENKPKWGAFAITESSSGSDAYALKTKAKKVDGGYILNGNKCFVTNGSRADFVITFATEDPKMGQFGIRSFIVDKNAPGMQLMSSGNTFGLRAASISEIFFDNCFVPDEQVLRVPNQKLFITALGASKSTWNFFRLEIAAMAVGTARAVEKEMNENYSMNTTSLKTDIMIGQKLYQKAAHGIDKNRPSQYDISIAKSYCAELAMNSCLDAIKKMGISCLHKGQLIERLFRDAKSFNILEGTGEIQRENIIKHFELQL